MQTQRRTAGEGFFFLLVITPLLQIGNYCLWRLAMTSRTAGARCCSGRTPTVREGVDLKDSVGTGSFVLVSEFFRFHPLPHGRGSPGKGQPTSPSHSGALPRPI